MPWTPISGGGGLSGVASADDYTDTFPTELVLDNGEATTGWTAVNIQGSIANDTTYFTTGTESVSASMRTGISGSKFYRDLSSPQAATGRDRILFDFLWTRDGSGSTDP